MRVNGGYSPIVREAMGCCRKGGKHRTASLEEEVAAIEGGHSTDTAVGEMRRSLHRNMFFNTNGHQKHGVGHDGIRCIRTKLGTEYQTNSPFPCSLASASLALAWLAAPSLALQQPC